jgi:hypothetical protein
VYVYERNMGRDEGCGWGRAAKLPIERIDSYSQAVEGEGRAEWERAARWMEEAIEGQEGLRQMQAVLRDSAREMESDGVGWSQMESDGREWSGENCIIVETRREEILVFPATGGRLGQ